MLRTLLPDEEIVRRLRAIRHTPRSLRYGRRATSINAIAVTAGLTPEHLFRIANGQRLGPKSRQALSQALSYDMMNGAKNGGRLHNGDGSRGPDRG